MSYYYKKILIRVLLAVLLLIVLYQACTFNAYFITMSDAESAADDDSHDDFIFVGGFGRSGTTLMRAILDAHPDLRCGPETKILLDIINWLDRTLNQNYRKILHDANPNYQRVLDSSMRAFIRSFIFNYGDKARRYCVKDPILANHFDYLHYLFPRAKFLLMARDVRAVSYSYANRIITSERNNIDFYKETIVGWNRFMVNTVSMCRKELKSSCMLVFYENLVMNTEPYLREIVEFLGVEWSDNLMKHEEAIKSNKTVVSESEWSTSQIKEPINKEMMNAWSKSIPPQVRSLVRDYAPMFKILGYHLESNDSFVNDNFANKN